MGENLAAIFKPFLRVTVEVHTITTESRGYREAYFSGDLQRR